MFENSGFIDRSHNYLGAIQSWRGIDYATICLNCGYAYGAHNSSSCPSHENAKKWGYQHFSFPYRKHSKIKVL